MASTHKTAAGNIEARNISPGDYVVILCTDPRDSCALGLPNTPGDYVFITRVVTVGWKDIVEGGDQEVYIKGHFLYNKNKDITKPLKERTKAVKMEMETWDIVDVFAAEEEPFELTEDNIAAIEASVKDIQEHDDA
jgi:hypothetical protein